MRGAPASGFRTISLEARENWRGQVPPSYPFEENIRRLDLTLRFVFFSHIIGFTVMLIIVFIPVTSNIMPAKPVSC